MVEVIRITSINRNLEVVVDQDQLQVRVDKMMELVTDKVVVPSMFQKDKEVPKVVTRMRAMVIQVINTNKREAKIIRTIKITINKEEEEEVKVATKTIKTGKEVKVEIKTRCNNNSFSHINKISSKWTKLKFQSFSLQHSLIMQMILLQIKGQVDHQIFKIFSIP